MSYKHILVAVDLSKSSEKVISRAVLLAKDTNAKVSLIFVDVDNVSNIGLVNLEIDSLPSIEEREKTLQQDLQALAVKADYPIENAIIVMGNFNRRVNAAVEKIGADLLVCGHHHDFWSRLLSATRKILNSTTTDLLIIYLDS
ncbi:universal stress protein containing UspA domain [Psychromonas ingrahamii 37]|uniref:Universal stress protein n=1 Tax=Psychromonas ingrahamii (strain DSM 17664 / CCUG 51855 / 37) TaxID=357804 RepID=A1STI0_PSYIN|nr:universal stress protein [Psychromonas ingrahamii]ABM02795.1 universal stress protein containing UspA domain [Psychromonas ingrahamii 37]